MTDDVFYAILDRGLIGRTRAVIDQRLAGRTYEQIGRALGVSRETARRGVLRSIRCVGQYSSSDRDAFVAEFVRRGRVAARRS